MPARCFVAHTDTIESLTDADLLDLAAVGPMFEGIDPDDILRFLRSSSMLRLRAGDTLVENGSPDTTAYLVVSGEIEVYATATETPALVAIRRRGELIGEMALITRSRRDATLRAKADVCLLQIESEHLHQWLLDQPVATLNVLRTAAVRMKGATAGMVQHQHLAALGTLAAGLSHELNNPTAALLRSTALLNAAVSSWEEATLALGRASAVNGVDVIERLNASISEVPPQPEWLDPITTSDREQVMQGWLQSHQVESAWEVAPVFVESGWTVERLETAIQELPDELVLPATYWLARGSQVRNLLTEVRLSGKTIGELVAAVKSYSRLDEAPVKLIDLHLGIDQSLTILKHKLRGLTVIKEFEPDMPRIMANATELNHLWTNLIDNAADAMNGSGELAISTSVDDGWASIEIVDSGPGIPPQNLDRLFEPFFSTKPPGKGVGLGLAIAMSTVNKHGGSIDVTSEPGRTSFLVRLPVRSESLVDG